MLDYTTYLRTPRLTATFDRFVMDILKILVIRHYFTEH